MWLGFEHLVGPLQRLQVNFEADEPLLSRRVYVFEYDEQLETFGFIGLCFGIMLM